jgi:hypothetical protein
MEEKIKELLNEKLTFRSIYNRLKGNFPDVIFSDVKMKIETLLNIKQDNIEDSISKDFINTFASFSKFKQVLLCQKLFSMLDLQQHRELLSTCIGKLPVTEEKNTYTTSNHFPAILFRFPRNRVLVAEGNNIRTNFPLNLFDEWMEYIGGTQENAVFLTIQILIHRNDESLRKTLNGIKCQKIVPFTPSQSRSL